MRSNACNRLGRKTSTWLLAATLAASACAKKNDADEPRQDGPALNDPGTDDGNGGKPPRKPRRKPDDGGNGTTLAPLKITVMVAAPDGIFATKIMTTLQTSCSTGGCHESSEYIDLRAFPFAAEGSYAMDDIRARLGDSPDPHQVQLALVNVLIDAMDTLYMPPAPADPIQPSDITAFREWLATDLERSPTPFAGRFYAAGKDAAGDIVCEVKGDIANGSFQGKIKREGCDGVVTATYEVVDQDGASVNDGVLSGEAFYDLEVWVIQI